MYTHCTLCSLEGGAPEGGPPTVMVPVLLNTICELSERHGLKLEHGIEPDGIDLKFTNDIPQVADIPLLDSQRIPHQTLNEDRATVIVG